MMLHKLVPAGAIALLALAVTGPLAAQGTYKKDISAKLAKQAKITEDAAAKIAQAKVPTGTIRAVELENEKGKLIYSYDIKIAGKDGIEEVNVNAIDGTVVGVEHESSATEAKEERQDAAKAKKKP